MLPLSLPLSLPGIVIGFFIILGFGRTGIVTDLIKGVTGWRNPQLAYTFYGLLLGYIYFQIPRVILVLRGAIAQIDEDTLHVARTLGLPPTAVFMRVIVPTLLPAIVRRQYLKPSYGLRRVRYGCYAKPRRSGHSARDSSALH